MYILRLHAYTYSNSEKSKYIISLILKVHVNMVMAFQILKRTRLVTNETLTQQITQIFETPGTTVFSCSRHLIGSQEFRELASVMLG